MSERRLAAIMFTDIVGYTALMGKDEEQAFHLLQKNSNIQRSVIMQFQGEFIKDIGDGILASFTTNVNAVRCAIAIQQAAWKEGYELRIGIHEGDLVFGKGDAWGDGVNIASRLQELADKGGIIISSAVFKDIRNKGDIKAQFIGEKILKNVEEPVKVYQVEFEKQNIFSAPIAANQSNKQRIHIYKPYFFIIGLILLTIAVFLWYHSRENPATELEKSIAVLPFKNLSTNPDEQYLADGMMDAVINHLQKIKELEVRSRTSVEQFRDPSQSLPEIGKKLNVNYIIEGSFQKVGDEANLIIQLLIAGDDRHIWASEYKRSWSDIFSVQSEVAQAIAGELSMILTQEERKKISESPTESLSAYDFYLRGKENHIRYFFSHNDQDFKNAIQLYRHALILDPEFTQVYADISWTFWWKEVWKGGQDTVNYLDSAMYYCDQVLSIDPDLSDAYSLRGLYYAVIDKKQEALENLNQAINLNPKDARAYRFLGLLYHGVLDYEKSIIYYRKAEKLEHNSYELLILKMKMIEFYLDIGDYEKAEQYINELMSLEPDYLGGYMWLGWLASVQGKFDKAIEVYQKASDLYPDVNFFFRKQAETFSYIKRFSESEEYWRKARGILREQGLDMNALNHRFAYTLWMNGKRNEAHELFYEFINFSKENLKTDPDRKRWGIYYNLAGTYAFLGDKKEALKWLGEQGTIGFSMIGESGFIFAYEDFILYDPLFENMRDDDEFNRIVSAAQEKKAKIRSRIKEIE